jgi:FkbH-like protein
LTLTPVSAEDARAFELVNKTNQFNLNGKRLSETEFRSALSHHGAVSLVVAYKDKFGPLGKIAVILGKADGSLLKIDSWVMSCRAFSRHIEYRCLEYLFETLGVSEIELEFQSTARNRPMRDFLSRFLELTPAAPVRIARDTFMSRKPALSHRLTNATYV